MAKSSKFFGTSSPMEHIRELFTPIEFILWDWNGTLLNDVPLAAELFSETVVRCGGEPLSVERYRELYEHPLELLYERSGIDLSRFSYEELSREWHVRYAATVGSAQLHETARTLLEFFSQRGTPQHILSALPQVLLDEAVELRKIRDHFGIVSGLQPAEGSTKFASGKKLVSQLGAAPEQVLLIGDTSHDAEVADELGIRCLLIANGAESRSRLEKTKKPLLSSLRELSSVFSLSPPAEL